MDAWKPVYPIYRNFTLIWQVVGVVAMGIALIAIAIVFA